MQDLDVVRADARRVVADVELGVALVHLRNPQAAELEQPRRQELVVQNLP